MFALTFLAPIGYAIYLSLFREQAFFGGTVFVGLDNYAEVLRDAKFWEAFRPGRWCSWSSRCRSC